MDKIQKLIARQAELARRIEEAKEKAAIDGRKKIIAALDKTTRAPDEILQFLIGAPKQKPAKTVKQSEAQAGENHENQTPLSDA